jgi:AraC-like DNA-binding protein
MVGDSLSFTQLFDLFAKELTFTSAMLITTMPRGGLQIAQPQRVSEPLLRAYLRDYAVEDRTTWAAILSGKAVKSTKYFSKADMDGTYFMTRFLRPNGYYYYAAAPVASAVFEGYPGVLWIGRTQEQGDFSDSDLGTLEKLASDLSASLVATRAARLPASFDSKLPWLHNLSEKVFIFDERLKQVLPAKNPAGLDGVLHDHMIRQARVALDQLNKKEEVVDRALLPDVEGDLWTFHVAGYSSLSAIGEGPYIVLTLQPQAADWITLSGSDFAADSELSRLLPAVRFMSKDFRSSPTLNEIAKQVHLSPFHFHRRFTELMGLTPKHFLLECQIHEAKTELVNKNKPLPQLATDTGFAHQSHFTSRFKQSTGLTPTRWRRLAARRSTTEAR